MRAAVPRRAGGGVICHTRQASLANDGATRLNAYNGLGGGLGATQAGAGPRLRLPRPNTVRPQAAPPSCRLASPSIWGWTLRGASGTVRDTCPTSPLRTRLWRRPLRPTVGASSRRDRVIATTIFVSSFRGRRHVCVNFLPHNVRRAFNSGTGWVAALACSRGAAPRLPRPKRDVGVGSERSVASGLRGNVRTGVTSAPRALSGRDVGT